MSQRNTVCSHEQINGPDSKTSKNCMLLVSYNSLYITSTSKSAQNSIHFYQQTRGIFLMCGWPCIIVQCGIRNPGSPNPLFDLAIHPTQLHTNKVSCATYFPMDKQPANQIWLPTQPRVCNLINLHIRSHLYTTAETTNHNNPPNKHENRWTYRPTNTRHIWK